MFYKIGHRGAMGLAPENTLFSFQKAKEMKVDMIELDVTLCKTGEIIVIHDDRVDRTTDGTGNVNELSLVELKNLDAGSGEKIPTLMEAIELIGPDTPINIELKNSFVVQPVVDLIRQLCNDIRWSLDNFVISSFDHHALYAFKRDVPAIRIGVLMGIIPLNYAQMAQELKAYSINPCIDFISQPFVDDAIARGLKTFVWTVNDITTIERMQIMKVDGIFTNYPDLF